MNYPLNYSFQRTSLPLIQIQFQGYFIPILLDTGSDSNYVDPRLAKQFKDEMKVVASNNRTFGVEGTEHESDVVEFSFEFERQTYTERFVILPDNNGLQKVHIDEKYQLLGIIGTRFMLKHGWVIDFSKPSVRTLRVKKVEKVVE